MSKIQQNGFETVRQRFGNQYLDFYLDGSDCQISGSNLGKIAIKKPLVPDFSMTTLGTTGMYIFEYGLRFDATEVGDELVFYDGTSSSTALNPFSIVYGSNLANVTVHLKELYCYGYGSDSNNYTNTTFRYKVDPNFPASSAASGTRGCLSYRYTLIDSANNWRCPAATGQMSLKVEAITTTGTPTSSDYVYWVGYKLICSRVGA